MLTGDFEFDAAVRRDIARRRIFNIKVFNNFQIKHTTTIGREVLERYIQRYWPISAVKKLLRSAENGIELDIHIPINTSGLVVTYLFEYLEHRFWGKGLTLNYTNNCQYWHSFFEGGREALYGLAKEYYCFSFENRFYALPTTEDNRRKVEVLAELEYEIEQCNSALVTTAL